MTPMTIDELVQDAGGCGPYQFLMVLIPSASAALSVWGMLFMVFGALEPDWWCLSRDLLRNASQEAFSSMAVGANLKRNGDFDGFNASVSEADLNENGVVDVNAVWKSNSTYKVCGSDDNRTGVCETLFFDPSISTIVSEFHLVCDLAWVPSMTISAQMAGVLVGCTLAGQLADSIGRKKNLVIMTTLHAVFNLVSAFSVSWQMFAVMRLLVGLTTGGLISTCFGYPTEFVSIKWRALLGAIPFWGIGATSFSLMVWVLRDWKHLHISTAICTAVCLPAWIFLPESMRWLTVRGRVNEAYSVLRKMARANRRTAPSPQSVQQLCSLTCQRVNYNPRHLFASRELSKASILLGLLWFSCSLAYFVMSFGIKDFSGDFFLNFFLMSIAELPPCLLVFHFCKWFGRRWTISGSNFLCTVCILAVVPVTWTLSAEDGAVIVNGLCMVARLSLLVAWSAMALFVAELYPTVVRNIALGYCNTVARFGGILAPYVLYVGEPHYFFLIIGISMTITSGFPLFLRETRDQPLEEELTVSKKGTTITQNQEEQCLQSMI